MSSTDPSHPPSFTAKGVPPQQPQQQPQQQEPNRMRPLLFRSEHDNHGSTPTTATTRSPPRSGAPPHVVQEPIPILSSAPSSAGFDFHELQDYMATATGLGSFWSAAQPSHQTSLLGSVTGSWTGSYMSAGGDGGPAATAPQSDGAPPQPSQVVYHPSPISAPAPAIARPPPYVNSVGGTSFWGADPIHTILSTVTSPAEALSTTSATASASSGLPPPPPPPPPRGASSSAATGKAALMSRTSPPRFDRSTGGGSAMGTATTTTASTMMAPLPPPPNVLSPPKQQQQQQHSFASSSASSGSALSNPTLVASRRTGSPPPSTQSRRAVSPPPASSASNISTASTTTTIARPEGVPFISFATPGLHILAQRHTHLTILVLATEAAHVMAWKSNLLLTDLLQGLAPTGHASNSSTAAGSNTVNSNINNPITGGGNTSTAATTTNLTLTATTPFRSATKQLQIAADSISLQFIDADVPGSLRTVSEETALNLLQQHAALQPADGDLNQELDLLEDQVDHLFKEDDEEQETYGRSGPSSSSSSSSLSWHVMDAMADRQRQLDQAVKDAHALTSRLSLPWLWRYRQALDAATAYAASDVGQCPVLCLTVCTTHEKMSGNTSSGQEGDDQSINSTSVSNTTASVIDTLRTLQSQHFLPQVYHNGLYDPAGVRYEALVLHDNVQGSRSSSIGNNKIPFSADHETALRAALLRNFGSHATLLRINSISLETAEQLSQEETSDLWGGGGTRGNCLSVSDRVALRKYITTHLITSAVLPAMERRIADLNVVVSERKKGVRNVLKSLWRGGSTSTSSAGGGGSGGGKTREEEDMARNLAVATGVRYRYDAIENQTRLLGDSLFLMKDYDAALSMYRLIKDDFKHDKAHLYYAALQEIMALCLYMMDPYGRSREIFSLIETALLSYSRAADDERPSAWGEKPRAGTASLSTRLATRLCLVLTSMYNICAGRALEVADLLASASSHETPLGAAVLLEQSSNQYYQAGMFRKYAFHMLMSGHMYRAADQEHHAFRCFVSALILYRQGRWQALHNHLRSALAAQLYTMGRMAMALQLYVKLVGASAQGGQVSVRSQQKFIHHVLEICNEHPSKALVAADRMASSTSTHSSSASDRRRPLERMVQVIRGTRGASRVLELPHVDLPGIDDGTVRILADETFEAHPLPHQQHDATATSSGATSLLGDLGRGVEDVWEELTLQTVAELRAAEQSKKAPSSMSSMDEGTTLVLAKIADPEIRRVIGHMDKERASRAIQERAKRSPSYLPTPPVRALMEPITVEFAMSNPLGIPVDVTDLQLVATMTESMLETQKQSHNYPRVSTNEDPVKITPLVSSMENKSWTFQSAQIKFSAAEFCRVSDGTSQDPELETWRSAKEVDPFFVVTKSDVTLAPESRRTIAVSICPLVQGSLEILGVRCRLFDDVWVYHPFDIKGPLLQNTRSNRANRIRGESLLLKAEIQRGMPCLSVDLLRRNVPMSSGQTATHGGPMLQGQITQWQLRIANVGTSPASGIAMKTNLPWICLDDQSSHAAAISNCVGPSGTLMRVPIQGDGLQQQGQIQPGEVVHVPIEVRTSGTGKQDFYILFRYELCASKHDADVPLQSQRHRWLRKMFQVAVYPALSMTTSLLPSFKVNAEHVLTVEVTNHRTDRPDKLQLSIDRVCVASRHYRLDQLPGQLSCKSNSVSTELGWQERMTLHYRLVECLDSPNAALVSECWTKGGGGNASGDPVSLLKFLSLERAFEEFEDTLKSHRKALARASAAQNDESHPRSIAQIRRANTSMASFAESEMSAGSRGHATSLSRLFPPQINLTAVHAICLWSHPEQAVFGLHFIRDLQIRSIGKTRACPIAITAQYPTTVDHNFDQGPPMVPLEVTLRNRLVNESVNFEFLFDRSGPFHFTGPECFKTTLCGGEHIKLPIQALIPAPGIYNLQQVRLSLPNSNTEDPVSYLFPMQWMVIVSDISMRSAAPTSTE